MLRLILTAAINCIAEKICFALENEVTLLPGETKEIHYVLGIAFSKEEIKSEVQILTSIEKEYDNVIAQLKKDEEGVTIHTPDSQLNALVNVWLKHQTNMGSRWARVRHNGYRDMVSDSERLGSFNAHLGWKRFKRALTYQYSNGYAPRTWLDGEIKNNNFADCAVWIPMAAYTLIMEMGDIRCLEEVVSFNDGTKASVYEHIKRAIDFFWNFRGLHGFIKIWGGDWNDLMNQAGLEGRGVSIWLSIAWYRANNQFIKLAEYMNKSEDATLAGLRGMEMKEIVNEFGWDGKFYKTAYNDQNQVIGSLSCEEGKMYLIPQLWAVLSGIGKDGKEIKAMDTIEKYLETDLGTLVSWPAYHTYQENIGQMTQKPAGVHENGGVYLHPATWKLAVDAIQKKNYKVEEGLQKILPFHSIHTKKMCESYIMCNSYFTAETGYREGTAGQSWRSATGAWLMKALVEYVFGLKAEMEGLRLEPCLPKSWRKCDITKHFRGSCYNIHYIQEEDGSCNHIAGIMINKEPYNGWVLPYEEDKVYDVIVQLKNDGRSHYESN